MIRIEIANLRPSPGRANANRDPENRNEARFLGKGAATERGSNFLKFRQKIFLSKNVYKAAFVYYNVLHMWVLILQIMLLGVSLAMDAFAVSVTDGMCYGDLSRGKAVTVPLTFGIFQAAMPLAGFFLGTLFISYIDSFDHYVAFGLLLLIGGKMMLDGIKELRSEESSLSIKKFRYGEVFLQGIATSIDALAVGISMLSMAGITDINVFGFVAIIGVETFIISLTGLIIGKKIGKLFAGKASVAEIVGGLVLIGIGIKVLVEGLIA